MASRNASLPPKRAALSMTGWVGGWGVDINLPAMASPQSAAVIAPVRQGNHHRWLA